MAMMVLPVYVINLDRRPDRMAFMATQLERIGLPFERVPAVDARTLAEANHISRMPQWYMHLDAIACTQSHARALRRFLGPDADAALILEDDAALATDVPTMCQGVDWWPAGTSAISLESPHTSKGLQGWLCGQSPSGRDLRMIVRWNMGAAAYLVNRMAAAMLVESYAKQDLHTDRMMFDPRLSATARRLRPVQVIPAAARQRQEEFESDLVPWVRQGFMRKKRRRLHMALHRSPWWEFKTLWWRATGRARRMRVPYSEAVS